MSFPYSGENLEQFLSRTRMFSAMVVPVYLILLFSLAADEGWRWSYLALGVLPPIAAVLGYLGKRDIRPGLAVAALVMSLVPLPVIGGLEALF